MPRSVEWIACSEDDISALPDPVKTSFGHRLREVLEHHTNNRLCRSDKDARQNKELELFSDLYRSEKALEGQTPLDTKPLPQFGGGAFELRERFDSDAHRLVYVVALKKAVYVLHAFMKKSKSGIGLPKPDAELTELRLKRAQALDAED